MSNEFLIHAEPRENTGKAIAKRLRRAGRVPAVVYGAGKEPASISLDKKEITHALENEAFYSHILSLKIAGAQSAEKIVLKALHRHPFKPFVLHADFLRVSDKEKLTMKVPLHLIGEDKAPGVKQDGGVLNKLLSEIEISCLPADLPEFIELDVTTLELNETLHLSDIKAPQGVEILALSHDDDQAVVSIHIPKEIPDQDEVSESEDDETTTAKGDDAQDADNDDAGSNDDK